ncbi:MAG: hypothetical protein ACRD5G_12425, partial [Candidatus Acidiferrales bacterium]
QPRLQLGETLLDLTLAGHKNILGQKWFYCYTYFLTLAKRLQRAADHQPVSVKQLALGLPSSAWKEITCEFATLNWPLSMF